MKKRLAIVIVALMLITVASSALALVPESAAVSKRSPVYINRMTVTDPYLNSLSVSNWGSSLANTQYNANTPIFFLAEIVVSSQKDTDDPNRWATSPAEAELVFTSSNNSVNFSSANIAFFGQINGYSMNMQSVTKNLSVTSNKATFYLNNDSANNFQGLYMPASSANSSGTYYLHFSAMTNTSGEGICKGTLSLGEGNATMAYNKVYPLYNSRNVHTYNVMKLKNASGGPYQGKGNIYAVTDAGFTRNIISFVVSSQFEGLARYHSSADWLGTASPTSSPTSATDANAFDPAKYENVMRNSVSGSVNEMIFSNGDVAITNQALNDVFNFFGFSYSHAGVPNDSHFIGKGNFVTSAEARFNVLVPGVTAIPTYPPVNVPKTGDAPSNSGWILAGIAMLMASTLGFVSKKRSKDSGK